jgi:aldose 1-epimerase
MKSHQTGISAMGLAVALAATIGCSSKTTMETATADETARRHPVSQTDSHAAATEMTVGKEPFGKTPTGVAVDLYTLTNTHGLRVKIMTYGAAITSVETPDRNGKRENITLAMPSLQDYLKGVPYFGATVGRYANRIAKGRFQIDGVAFKLATNNGPNHLHGGVRGFDKVVWKAEPASARDSVGVVFSYESPDGEEGYPGKLSVRATYSITDDNELEIRYVAVTDKPTIVNLANHAYWNLAGGQSADILGQELTINADKYLPVDGGLIPLGELRDVKGTAMDFTAPHAIGERIKQVDGGYDHCWVLNRADGKALSLAARLVEPRSGRVMEIRTTQPAIQFYSGNFLDGTLKAGNRVYRQHGGFCLEPEHYPDAPNRPDFPSTLLRPGERYEQASVYRFSVM